MGGYDNEEGEQAPCRVGPGEPYDNIAEALGMAPGRRPPASFLSARQPNPLPGGKRTGPDDRRAFRHPGSDGRPTAVLRVSRISVAPGASLRLEDLIVEADAGGRRRAALLANSGQLTLENCIVRGGGHGILHTGGGLMMRGVYVSGNILDGLRMEGGYAELVNCEFVENGGNGLNVTAATRA